ncbi:sensor histidine kinase [Aureivirga marina]|uniref:sensor histidine kinase n=1 Tax=Aureivirga marina TaxID=1182451 RepID=UPI0018C9C160|nr:sensor histidine kinase [Aureivirga marina]
MWSFFKNNGIVVKHIFVWSLIIVAISLQLYYLTDRIPYPFLSRISFNIGLYYLNYIYLVPYLLLNRKKVAYWIIVFVLCIGVAVVFEKYLTVPRQWDYFKYAKNSPYSPKLAITLVVNFLLIFIGISNKIFDEWSKREKREKEVEKQQIVDKLEYLKHQINPHFLFNSLNSIYSLSVKKSDNAPEAIITLSDLMRYMLYQTDSEFVPLEKELDYIRNYFNLQRLRIAKSEKVNLRIEGLNFNYKIRPLILISFIENAFKYGTNTDGNTEIDVRIYIEKERLFFYCENIIGNMKQKENSYGIGLKNTRERLNLLYPNQYELKVETVNNKFRIELILNLEV